VGLNYSGWAGPALLIIVTVIGCIGCVLQGSLLIWVYGLGYACGMRWPSTSSICIPHVGQSPCIYDAKNTYSGATLMAKLALTSSGLWEVPSKPAFIQDHLPGSTELLCKLKLRQGMN
jgi:hypothetical protein